MKRMLMIVLAVSCCVTLPIGVASQSSTNYQIVGANLNAGGSANMASTNYKASVTLGQSSPVGIASSASYQAQMGVQYVYQQTAPEPQFFLLWTK